MLNHDAMRPDTRAWDEIFRKEGRVFLEPFPRFGELVRVFRERDCSRLLDLGCGSGRHVVGLAREGFQVCGLDASPTGLRLTREWLVGEGLAADLVLADMREPFPFRTGAFEGLLSTQVIHHARIAEIRRTIREIWRVLVPGGMAFVTVSACISAGEQFIEIEPGTFMPVAGPEAGLPHHIFSEAELLEELQALQVSEIVLRAEGKVLTALAQKP